MGWRARVVCLALACAHCGDDSAAIDAAILMDAEVDASVDAGTDARGDAAAEDAGSDAAAEDAVVDADPRDSGSDASEVDAGADGGATVGFVVIQEDLDNEGCTTASCHASDARNVLILPGATGDNLRANWERITNVDDGVTPWVLPPDDRAQMLREVPVPDEVRSRWLSWIEDGAPFE
ncbi:MAG: hypothetical protein AAGE52_28490 [Myxococcota bacterium]